MLEHRFASWSLLSLLAVASPSVLAKKPAAQGKKPTADKERQPVAELVQWIGDLARPEFGVAEAQRQFGGALRPLRPPSDGYQDLEVVSPRGLARVVLETHLGELIGLQLEFADKQRFLDEGKLRRALGVGKRGVAPVDSLLPQPYNFSLKKEHYLLMVVVQPGEPGGVGKAKSFAVRNLIIRRIPGEEIVPDRWDTEDALVALVRLVLRPRPLPPATLYGSLGIFSSETPNQVVLERVGMRNVAETKIGKAMGAQGVAEVKQVETRFIEAIDVKPAQLAKRLGARLMEADHKATLRLPRGEIDLLLNEAQQVAAIRLFRGRAAPL